MAFNRIIEPGPRPPDQQLTARMAGIGMNFAVYPDPHANIEDTLLHASEMGMLEDDLRVLSILTTWMETHHSYINADRLVRASAEHSSDRVRAYWSALGTWLHKDRRLSRLSQIYDGPVLNLLSVSTEFQIERHGEDERFKASSLRVPNKTLRDRQADILPPHKLAALHRGYRNRILMGPSWRADI